MQAGTITGEINVDGLPNHHFEVLVDQEILDMASDELKELVGDSKARISVSVSLKDSDYGKGYGVQVTTTLSVDQNEESLEQGFLIARELSVDYANQAFEEARELYEANTSRKS